ncbi:hypothetical protein BGM19_36380 [Streptomyces agglomeratus]|uniref:Uncharacterized protein n=1 Tax=Streptomyces agglomeratus TaxID=285458 RepID=A0A1E5P0Z7_9ACTN|nr:hypothetical protein [Streptomyces agglomeratus]OEJ23189.1 hypothetical protein AS594_00280 [Streptomyces agglomeratus]OEJ55292.1 hypothetical protein BGK72_35560 [Streptomyces agglomeratus]OEJ62641.1 hypothetical protein BGM19_36380 [Streptomyces agglomeratus]
MASPDSEFLTRVSEAAFELGTDGFRVTAMTIKSRQIGFTDTGTTPDPPLYMQGEPPPVPGRQGRREYDWQPATHAPAWMNMAWLLEDLATWIQPLADEHVTLLGIEAPLPHWCDILLRDGDTAYRVRVALADRSEPLDFPGMYLRDMLTEGRHRDHLTPTDSEDETPLVDLRTVL